MVASFLPSLCLTWPPNPSPSLHRQDLIRVDLQLVTLTRIFLTDGWEETLLAFEPVGQHLNKTDSDNQEESCLLFGSRLAHLHLQLIIQLLLTVDPWQRALQGTVLVVDQQIASLDRGT